MLPTWMGMTLSCANPESIPASGRTVSSERCQLENHARCEGRSVTSQLSTNRERWDLIPIQNSLCSPLIPHSRTFFLLLFAPILVPRRHCCSPEDGKKLREEREAVMLCIFSFIIARKRHPLTVKWFNQARNKASIHAQAAALSASL